MKILVSMTVYWPAVNGASLYAHQMNKHLAGKNTITVVTQSRETQHDWLFTPTLDSKGPFFFQDGGVDVYGIAPSEYEKKFLWLVLNSPPFFSGVQKHALKSVFRKMILNAVKGVDVLHNYLLDMDYFNELCYESAIALEIPYVVTPFIHAYEGQSLTPSRTRLIKRADAVVALTHKEKTWLCDLGIDKSKICVAPPGHILSENFSGETFRGKLGITGRMILFMATKRSYKGYQHLAAAMPLVWKKHTDVCFVFIGQRTKESISFFSNIQDPRVFELGTVDLDEKTSALAACDVFCMPSIAESFGIVFIEAWMMGKPVIAGDCLVSGEIIEEGRDGFIVPQDSEIISDRIIRLLDDQKMSAQMGAAGKKKVCRDYLWSNAAEQLNALYLSLT